MNKGSHISLALFLMQKIELNELKIHKRAFLIGSILPDCRPSFLTIRHTMAETFEILRSEIRSLFENYNKNKGISAYTCLHLGIILHYIADYFTFPHNPGYHGSMKEHIEYEKSLSTIMHQYIECEAFYVNTKQSFMTVDELSDYIVNTHRDFLTERNDMITDCSYILEVCFIVAVSIQSQLRAVSAIDQDVRIQAA